MTMTPAEYMDAINPFMDLILESRKMPAPAWKLIQDCPDYLQSIEDFWKGYKECKSPIEQILFVALLRLEAVDIFPQFNVKAGGKRYIADFKIDAFDYPNTEDQVCTTVLIECDGHDYHEKTKEQAKHDKSRDRALIAEGYQVLHFTGSEIWNEPLKCMEEIQDFIDKENKVKLQAWEAEHCEMDKTHDRCF